MPSKTPSVTLGWGGPELRTDEVKRGNRIHMLKGAIAACLGFVVATAALGYALGPVFARACLT